MTHKSLFVPSCSYLVPTFLGAGRYNKLHDFLGIFADICILFLLFLLVSYSNSKKVYIGGYNRNNIYMFPHFSVGTVGTNGEKGQKSREKCPFWCSIPLFLEGTEGRNVRNSAPTALFLLIKRISAPAMVFA